MEIHQIQVKVDPLADRLLLQVRTRDEKLFAVWLTRRLTMRLLPHLVQTVSALAVARTAPGALAVPEARDMLAAAARDRALQNADFETAFDASSAQSALGPEPMLPAEVDLVRGQSSGLSLRIRDRMGRSLDLFLGEEFALAFLQLVERAAVQADWGLGPVRPGAGSETQSPAPRLLN